MNKKEKGGGRTERKSLLCRIPEIVGYGYAATVMAICMCQTVYAADIFDTAKSAMQKVYTDVAGLATVAAVVCAAVCLFLMNFSKSVVWYKKS